MMLLDLPVYMGDAPKNEKLFLKYQLYSDAFMGFLDPVDYRGSKEDYEKMSERLIAAGKNSAYGYIFESNAALCRALAIKFDLGQRTREAYKSGNKEALEAVVADYEKVIAAVEEFVTLFRKLWFKENKPHGFDVHELRLGGLLMRLRSQRERLIAYLSCEADKIDELEEELLEYNGHGISSGLLPTLNSWKRGVTPNVL